MRPDNIFLITYGSVVSITWFLAYWFVDSAWVIVYLDGVVHLICGAVVALAVIQIPQFKQVEVVAILILVLVFWEVLEGGLWQGNPGIPDWKIMDTASDLMLGAIGGIIIIFDGHKLENLQHQGD